MSRRIWLWGAAAAVSGGLVCGFRALNRVPVAEWTLRRRWDGIPFGWGHHRLVVNADRRVAYQFRCHSGQFFLHTIDLETFELRSGEFEGLVLEAGNPLLHPTDRTLWFAERGRGPVWRLDPETLVLERVGGVEPSGESDEGAAPYWNPHSGRMGSFGGGSGLRVRNWRWEFDVRSGRWIEVQPDDPAREPWCRTVPALDPVGGGKGLVMFGGLGNSTGEEGVRDAGFKLWNARFHFLGDVWRLDLATGVWARRSGLPGLELRHVYGAHHSSAVVEASGALVVAQAAGSSAPEGSPFEMSLHRLQGDAGFVPIRSEGEVPDGRAEVFLAAMPGKESFLAVSHTGFHEVRLVL